MLILTFVFPLKIPPVLIYVLCVLFSLDTSHGCWCHLVSSFIGNVSSSSLWYMQDVIYADLQRNEENRTSGFFPVKLFCLKNCYWDHTLQRKKKKVMILLNGWISFFVKARIWQYIKTLAKLSLYPLHFKHLKFSASLETTASVIVSPWQQQSSSGSSVCCFFFFK